MYISNEHSIYFQYSIFNLLCCLSFIAVFIVFLVYIRAEKKNHLLIVSACVVLLILALLLVGSILFIPRIDAHSDFCHCQGIMLNYFFICIHALICCLMFDTWSRIARWRPRIFAMQSPANAQVAASFVERFKLQIKSYYFLYYVVSFIVPIIPTLVLVYYDRQDNIIQPKAFYCYIHGQFLIKFFTSTVFFMLFSVIGMSFAVFVFFKTIWMRQRSLRKGRTTHLSRFSVFRIGASTFLYTMFALSSFLPSMLYFRSDLDPAVFLRDAALYPSNFQLNDYSKSPFTNPDLCYSFITDKRFFYYADQRCPSFSSFIPSVLGIVFFCMYGFGKYMRKSFSAFYRRMQCLFPKSRKAAASEGDRGLHSSLRVSSSSSRTNLPSGSRNTSVTFYGDAVMRQSSGEDLSKLASIDDMLFSTKRSSFLPQHRMKRSSTRFSQIRNDAATDATIKASSYLFSSPQSPPSSDLYNASALLSPQLASSLSPHLSFVASPTSLTSTHLDDDDDDDDDNEEEMFPKRDSCQPLVDHDSEQMEEAAQILADVLEEDLEHAVPVVSEKEA